MQSSEASATSHRASQILEALLRIGRVTVEELAARLEVSTATIRRDLTSLERQGLLRRVHGGAAPVEPMLYEPFRHLSSFQEQEQKFVSEKRRIALAAAETVSNGETIAIGAGTTTTQVARSIRHRKGITVVTNAVNVGMELSHRRDLKVFLTGGFMSGEWFALVGAAAISGVREIFVDKVFVGVDGISAQNGLTTNYPDQASVHRAMMQQARKRIVVADHRKFGVTATSLIWPASDVDLVITDKGASDAAIAPFLANGIEVRRV
jgi:DeoR family transcriptional regulator, aga operon transcriptional repressor